MKPIHRIVIKIGTSSLVHDTGKINFRRIDEVARVVADLKNAGYEPLLVSSGAIGVGLGKLNMAQRPTRVPEKQALAAIGQSSLMAIYEKCFNQYGQQVAQVLLTKPVLEDPHTCENIVNAFDVMFQYGVIPIVNENDVVSTAEIEHAGTFGDNDTLSAHVARVVQADLLVLWTDINGLYDADPKTHPGAKIIPVVHAVDDALYEMAGGAGSWRGTGGMTTKLNAAGIALDAGIRMVITNSNRPTDLYRLLEGEAIGTLFIGKDGTP